MFFKKSPPMPDNAPALLEIAQAEKDPKKRCAYLTRARELAPDDLAVRRALLMHGRLHEVLKNGIDYSGIKCWLLHAFEHPEKHGEEEKKRMAREIFDSPDLAACLALVKEEDTREFMRRYLFDLCLDYARIFIAGDHSHMPSIMGIAPKGKAPDYLARPAADVILNIFSCDCLSKQERALLSKQFYAAYALSVGGQVEPLAALLPQDARDKLA